MTEPAQDPYRLSGLTLAGKYRLEEYVGSGGMGAVYRALVTDDGRQVAVKVLKPDVVARDREYARLFEQEAESVRRLEHPNVVRMFDSGADQGYSYIVMEWLEGRTLEDEVAAGQLSLERVERILAQICDALGAAHAQQIIHLDVKPGNVFLLKDGRPGDVVKVIDFGMSRVLTRESGTTVTRFRGTIQYCAPEQFCGRVSSRSDVYGLGATLYHLLTGLLPFGTSYVAAKMHRGRELPPLPSIRGVRPDVPHAVDHVIKKALSKEPSERQQSVRQLYEEFHRAAFGATTLRLPPALGARLSSRVPARMKTKPAAWLAFSLFAFLWLAAGAALYYGGFDGLTGRRHTPAPPPHGPQVGTPSPATPGATQTPRPARPSGDGPERTTTSPTAVAAAAPLRPSAAGPETLPAPRNAPTTTFDEWVSISRPDEASPPREEFIERGEIVVPSAGAAPAPAGTPRTTLPADAQGDERRLMALINEERRSHGLKPFAWDGELSKLARQHALDMARGGYLSHIDRRGKDLRARATDAGLGGWKAINENIAYNQGYDDPTAFAVERWMVSERHRRNILDKEYTHAGVGIARAEDGRLYFTQVVMKR